MKNAANFDITGASVLESIGRDLRDRGKTLMPCGTTPEIRSILHRAGMTEVIGEDKILVAQKNLLESTRTALKRARKHIDYVPEEELDRNEENPDLEHTMKELREVEPDSQVQNPIRSEKHTADTNHSKLN